MSFLFTSPVVCNTGPIIGLARVQMEDLPSRLFPEVIVPEEVRDELLVSDSPDRAEIEAMLGSVRIHPRQPKPDLLLQAELDSGEAAVISAAISLGLPSVVLDERKARRVASQIYGLQVKGTAGLLIEAKSRGMIDAVRPYLEGMIEGGYFLGPALVAACLTAAGED
jgi:hypothetical protein